MDVSNDWAPSHPTGSLSLITSPLSRILLGPNLWFENNTHSIHRSGHVIPLTPSEDALLTALLATPHRFYSASSLARLIKQRGKPPIAEHSIQQTIHTLRRKLGETGQASTILINRRGFGYGLFPKITKVSR
jgi:DNA-binding response OmpR family regulator